MSVTVRERRGQLRIAAAYPVVIRDRRRRIIAKGRTANISIGGVYALLPMREEFKPQATFNVELSLPDFSSPRRISMSRIVEYRCRIVRIEPLGHMLGVGIEFLEKLA